MGSTMFKVELEEEKQEREGEDEEKKKKQTLESAMAEFPVFLQILKVNLEGTLKLLILPLKYTNTQSTTTRKLNVFSNLTEMKYQVFFI